MKRKKRIGKSTFDKENNKLEGQSEGAVYNRQRFIAYTNALEMRAMNTFSRKGDRKLATYMEMKTKGSPYTRGIYEMIDYIRTGERWKNTIRNIENDLGANIDTRHIPIIAEVEIM